MYLDFILIACVIVYIIDITGAVRNIIHPIAKYLVGIDRRAEITIPILDCSLCTTWWAGIIYFISICEFNCLNLFFVALVSYQTQNIKTILMLVNDFIGLVLNKLYDLVSKIS